MRIRSGVPFKSSNKSIREPVVFEEGKDEERKEANARRLPTISSSSLESNNSLARQHIREAHADDARAVQERQQQPAV